MEEIRWGMIGAGDVTELKSGPAFSKVSGSKLVAVMRRDLEKVKDYASRHNVGTWYTDAQALIDDPDINAIYIATPPDSHAEYAIRALKAGKYVYVEKPMVLTSKEAERVVDAVEQYNGKLTVAHYRREQPYFKKIQSLLNDQAIGITRVISMRTWKPSLTEAQLSEPKIQWRLDPVVSGGGLFHDLAPHQIDLMYYFFGEMDSFNGVSYNQAGLYQADDIVCGQIRFVNKALYTGSWAFNTFADIDECVILGSEGKLTFSIFDNHAIQLDNKEGSTIYSFEPLQYVQAPMIEATVLYFQGRRDNPCSAVDGLKVMKVLDSFVNGGSGSIA